MPTHAEQRMLPYSAAQMFDLVADIERYPEFLPWCIDCRIVDQRGPKNKPTLIADLTIGYKFLRETFTSEVTLDRENMQIDVKYIRGPFQHLDNRWRFLLKRGRFCTVDFTIDFEFRTPLLRKIMGVFFNEAVRRMVNAFETRAKRLYG